MSLGRGLKPTFQTSEFFDERPGSSPGRENYDSERGPIASALVGPCIAGTLPSSCESRHALGETNDRYYHPSCCLSKTGLFPINYADLALPTSRSTPAPPGNQKNPRFVNTSADTVRAALLSVLGLRTHHARPFNLYREPTLEQWTEPPSAIFGGSSVHPGKKKKKKKKT